VEGSVRWEDDAARDAYYESRFQALLEGGTHVHRCPICRKDSRCGLLDCRTALETAAGEPMVIKTCAACIVELGNESTGDEVYIGGYTRAIH
jgi:hypothetical protein